MSKENNLTDFLTDVANAIREKKGTTDLINPQNFSDEIKSIESGKVDSGGKYLLQVFDYDGTVIASDHLNEGDTFTLPNPPTHDKLVFQEWVCPLGVTDNKVTMGNGNLVVGATYKTSSGNTEFDITLTKFTGLTVTLQNLTGATDIDWGDGTKENTLSHTYSTYGDYTISVSDVTSLGETIFSQNGLNKNYYCTRIRLSENVTSIGVGTFKHCISLIFITIPNSIITIGANAFNYCESLKIIIIPRSIPYSVYNYAFEDCHSLETAVFPSNITGILPYQFDNCYSLKNITMPKNLTVLGKTAFRNCYSLTELVFLESFTSGIASDYTLGSCSSIIRYDFSKCTTIPDLDAVNSFQFINGICKIIVPDNLYDDWINAENWSTYANYIYKISEIK